MEYHLEHRVALDTDPEHKGLYKWALREIDADGNKVGRDMIPWPWRLSFLATKLTLIDSMKVQPKLDGDYKEIGIEGVEKPIIRADLRSGSLHRFGWHDSQSYSMFGTKRRIEEITLYIEVAEDGAAQTHAWGGVSYTSEIDFRDETIPDSITFRLFVSREAFERYANQLRLGTADAALLSVSKVDGFYSDWSPAISTGHIKVLTSDRLHPIEAAEGCEIVPARMGKIGELDFQLIRYCDIKVSEPPEDPGDYTDEMDEPAPVPVKAPYETLTLNALQSLKMAAWVITALLFAILIFKH